MRDSLEKSASGPERDRRKITAKVNPSASMIINARRTEGS